MVSFTELSKGVTRAAELLTVAAAHRAVVELCLGNQQQTGHQLAEMVEGWVTGEDALEVACWHLRSAGTCNLAQTPCRRSTRGKRPRTAPARLAGGERRFQHSGAQAEDAQTTIGRGTEGSEQGSEQTVAQQETATEVSGPPLSEQPPAMETSQRGSASCCFKRSACEAQLAGPEASASASASLLNGVTWEQMRLTNPKNNLTLTLSPNPNPNQVGADGARQQAQAHDARGQAWPRAGQ